MITPTAQFEALLRRRNLGWAIEIFSPRADAAAYLLERLARLSEFMSQRRLAPADFSPASLERLVEISPYKADAFLQAIVSIHSTEMLCASWRILQGMEIASVEVRHVRLESFLLRVVLSSPYDRSATEQYESADIGDSVFLRHLGNASVDRRPYFDGFFALRQT